jgi:hypothetical protein
MNKIDDKHHVLFLFRIKYDNGHYSTIGKLQKINNSKESKEELNKYIKNIIDISLDAYKDIPISSIVFSYGIRDGKIEINRDTKLKARHQTYYNNKLPIAYKPEDYGKIISKTGNIYFIY